MSSAMTTDDTGRGVLLRSRREFVRTAQALRECAWRKATLRLAAALCLFAVGTIVLTIWLMYRLTADFIVEFLAEGSAERRHPGARGGSGGSGPRRDDAKVRRAAGVAGPTPRPNRTARPPKPAMPTVELPEGAGVWHAGQRIYVECDNTGPMADALRKIGARYDREMGALWIGTAKADQVIEIVRRLQPIDRTAIRSGISQGE